MGSHSKVLDIWLKGGPAVFQGSIHEHLYNTRRYEIEDSNGVSKQKRIFAVHPGLPAQSSTNDCET